MATTRYPSDFTATPATDYLEIKMIRRDYSSTSPNYVLDSPPGGSNTLYLNMPQKLGESQSQNWANAKLGEIGPFIGNRDSTTGNNFFADIIKRLAENFVLGNAVNAFQKVGASGLNENGILSATSGIVYNPNLEVLYDGPDFRRFNYQFALFTKSEQDAKAINDVVRFFQYASVPSTGASSFDGNGGGGASGNRDGLRNTFLDATNINAAGDAVNTLYQFVTGNAQGTAQAAINTAVNTLTGLAGAAAGGFGAIFNGANRFIKQPPFLLLTYRRGGQEHPFLYSPMPCALNSLNIDYTPTGNYTVMDNFGKTGLATVVGVVITLQLTEIKNVFAEDYQANMTVSRRAPGINL